MPSNAAHKKEATQQDVTWLTTREMADRLRLHPMTVLKLAKSGRIPCLRAGRAVRFPAEQVVEALTRGGL